MKCKNCKYFNCRNNDENWCLKHDMAVDEAGECRTYWLIQKTNGYYYNFFEDDWQLNLDNECLLKSRSQVIEIQRSLKNHCQCEIKKVIDF